MADRYRMTFKCSCGNVFKRITTNINLENPPCPECKSKQKKLKQFKIGDGPIPVSETKAEAFDKPKIYPNTIYKCKDCSAILKVFEEVGEESLSECYSCGGHNVIFRGKISKDIPTGSAMNNKAVDITANIVMEDYKMTDLKDNVRAGESMAPKLASGAQAMADEMIGKGSKDGMMSVYDANTRRIIRMPTKKNRGAMLAKAALSGSLRDKNYRDPVAAIKPEFKPRTEYVNAITGAKE